MVLILFIVCTSIFLCRIQKLTRACVTLFCFLQTLNKAYCIVGNGGWSNWTKISTCSVSCGVGIQFKKRSCTNPSPNEIGAFCVGESYSEKMCHGNNCLGKFDRIRKKYNLNSNCLKKQIDIYSYACWQWSV